MKPATASTLLIATAGIESAVGALLLIAPSLVTQILLGTQLSTPAALVVARVAGAALLAIGISCWLEGRRPAALPLGGLVGGLLVYNLAVFALLIYATLAEGLRGIGTWPTCALHLFMAIWCVRVMQADRADRSQHSSGS